MQPNHQASLVYFSIVITSLFRKFPQDLRKPKEQLFIVRKLILQSKSVSCIYNGPGELNQQIKRTNS